MSFGGPTVIMGNALSLGVVAVADPTSDQGIALSLGRVTLCHLDA